MDIVFLILLALFMYRGYRRGLILAFFSVLAFCIGLVGAIKLSGTIALKMADSYPEFARWLPFISYLLIFIVLAWLVRVLGKILEKSVEWMVLGWLNRLSGALLYGFLCCFAGSLLLWLMEQLMIMPVEMLQNSRIVIMIQPLAPKAVGFLTNIFPFLKQLFESLSAEFETLNHQIREHVGVD